MTYQITSTSKVPNMVPFESQIIRESDHLPTSNPSWQALAAIWWEYTQAWFKESLMYRYMIEVFSVYRYCRNLYCKCKIPWHLRLACRPAKLFWLSRWSPVISRERHEWKNVGVFCNGQLQLCKKNMLPSIAWGRWEARKDARSLDLKDLAIGCHEANHC